MTDHIKHITTLVKKMNSRLNETLKNIKGSTTKSLSRKITEIQKHNIEISFILIDIISNYRDLIPAKKRDKLELDISMKTKYIILSIKKILISDVPHNGKYSNKLFLDTLS